MEFCEACVVIIIMLLLYIIWFLSSENFSLKSISEFDKKRDQLGYTAKDKYLEKKFEY